MQSKNWCKEAYPRGKNITAAKGHTAMPSENPDQQLHDKATRGEALTLEEQARLEAWYGQLDRTEGAQLAGKPSVGLLVQLQAQVEEATAELLKMVRPGVCGQARCLEPIRPNYRGTRL